MVTPSEAKHTMTGKEKCSLLRKMRRRIAEHNGVPFDSPDCPFTGECRGTCPKCDEELYQLELALDARRKKGLPVELIGLCTDAFKEGTGERNG